MPKKLDREREALIYESASLRMVFDPSDGGRAARIEKLDCPSEETVSFGFSLNGRKPDMRNLELESGLVMASSTAGHGLGLEIRADGEEGDVCALTISVRNRTLQAVPYDFRLDWTGLRVLAPNALAGNGIVAVIESTPPRGVEQEGSRSIYPEERALAPRCSDVVRIAFMPGDCPERPTRVTRAGCLTITEVDLSLLPFQSSSGAKLILQTTDGRTMDTRADLVRGCELRYGLDEIGGQPSAFAVLDDKRRTLLRYERDSGPAAAQVPAWEYSEAPSEEQLTEWETSPPARFWVANHRARAAFRRGAFREAADECEQALLYNGDDPITWIERAVALRHAGLDDESAPELPNAHWLAPLDPMLRAESFLRGDGAAELLRPLAAYPEEIAEAACAYLDLGLYEDAARWLAAADQIESRPLFGYLFAFCALQAPNMKAEAAAAVMAADALPRVGPFPWRGVEKTVFATLMETFPDDPELTYYAGKL